MRRAEEIERRVENECFEPLGWLDGRAHADVPGATVLLVGNAGPAMFDRFASERDPSRDLMDEWTRDVLGSLADDLDAKSLFPFDKPPLPFLTWAREAKAGHVSPLGLNIRADFGLWHAFRAAFVFADKIDFAPAKPTGSPCDSCQEKPCLSACPAGAFTNPGYDVAACTDHLGEPQGAPCRGGGCLARMACPVAPQFRYSVQQSRFHMVAFMKARGVELVRMG